jgi:hypothetical protein
MIILVVPYQPADEAVLIVVIIPVEILHQLDYQQYHHHQQ